MQLDDALRRLLKQGRQRQGLTQAKAAERAHISTVWWKQLESGTRDVAEAETVAAMLEVVRARVRVVREMGHDELARALQERYDWFGSEAL